MKSRTREGLIQIAVLAILATVAGLFVRAAMQKLGGQQTASGFGFLSNSAGFDISESVIHYESGMSYGKAILAGFLNTLIAAFFATLLATVFGLSLGLARLSSNFMLRNTSLALSEVIRNTPVLLQLMAWYAIIINSFPVPSDAQAVLGIYSTNRGIFVPGLIYSDSNGALWGLIGAAAMALVLFLGLRKATKPNRKSSRAIAGLYWAAAALVIFFIFHEVTVSWPQLEGFNINGGASLSPEMGALVIGLAVYAGAFLGEVIRSGMISVPIGQKEAAYAIGLSQYQRTKLVVLPQALRLILPPASNIYLSLAKNTSLGVAIGFPDLTAVIGTTINQSGQAIEGVLIQMAAYLGMSMIVWLLINLYDRRTRYEVR